MENNRNCPFCEAVPIIWDATGHLKIEHETDCFFTLNDMYNSSIQWIVSKKSIEAWNKRFKGDMGGQR